MNLILTKSVLLFSFPLLYSLYLYNNTPIIIRFSIITGLFTSIINHGTSNIISIISDRLVMIINIPINYYYIYFISLNNKKKGFYLFLLLHTSIFLYIYSKYLYIIILHIFSHGFITLYIILLLFYLDSDENNL
jgi:hypothetical protein